MPHCQENRKKRLRRRRREEGRDTARTFAPLLEGLAFCSVSHRDRVRKHLVKLGVPLRVVRKAETNKFAFLNGPGILTYDGNFLGTVTSTPRIKRMSSPSAKRLASNLVEIFTK